ncbi:hypothetical protein V2J09_019132 [Rumex salicifolius]
MQRRNVERKTSGYCKIRKRVSSSSSSATSLNNYRLKRAILVAKRENSSTLVPSWKMDLRSPSMATNGDKGKEAQMSARRLAATLWDFNGGGEEEEEEKENFKGRHSHMLDHSCSPLCKKDGSKQSRHRRRSSEKLELIEYIGQGKDSVHHDMGPSIVSRLRDVSTSLTTSKELVKVLFKMWSQEEQNTSNLTLVSALRVEIDRARHQVDCLMHEKRYSQREIDSLLKHFACEKAAWKIREKDKISNAVLSVSRELEVEKKLRRQTERLNKTLGRELADTKDKLHKAMEDLGCERRAREILEQTCDELAIGLGEDGNEVKELKRECDKVREETERERQMLQLADVLREERVQMKLADARYEYEEKNAALERMKSELEAYLGGGKATENSIIKVEEEEDSGESELHSIELSVDNLSKGFKWSFGNGDSRRASVEEMFKGRRSLCEKIQWENICLQRKTSNGLEWDFSNSRKENGNGVHKGRLSESSSQGERNDKSVMDSRDQIDDHNNGGT